MHPRRKQRLLVIGFIVGGVALAVALALVALEQSINHFYDPSQIEAGEAPVDQRIRIGGMVVDNTVVRAADSLKVRFDLTDYKGVVTVAYEGILPDLFREGQGIVTQGRMQSDGIFYADEVLAKHDENYMPPEVQRAVERAQQ